MRSMGTQSIINRKGRIGIIAILTALTFIATPFSIVSIGGKGVLIFVGIPLLIVSAPSIIKKNSLINLNNHYKWLFFFLAYDLLTYLWSPEAAPTVFIRTIAVTICIILNKYSIREKYLLGLVALVIVFINFYFMYIGYYTGVGGSERLSIVINGVETDCNYIALCFFPAVACMSYVIFYRKHILFPVFILLLVLYCMLQMGTRAAFLSCFVIFFCVLITTRGHKLRMAILLFLVGITIVEFIPLIMQLLPDSVAERFSAEMLFGSKDNAGGRTDIWVVTINYMINNPEYFILGRGAGSTTYYLPMATHNYLLQILFELGIIGLVFFIGFVVSFIKFVWKQRCVISFALFVGSIFMSLSLAVNTQLCFWINIAMSYAFFTYENTSPSIISNTFNK